MLGDLLPIDPPTRCSQTQGLGRSAHVKTIRKFVLELSRDVRRTRRQVREEDHTTEPRDPPEVSPQSAEPQRDVPPVPTVWGKVKWYSSIKRYGFVELLDGSGDAFLHATALAGRGISTLRPGETLELQVAPGERGPQVTQILSVDTSTAAPPRPSRKRFRSPSDRHLSEASVQEMGTVKWYNVAKGFGFIIMDGDAKEVFVHATALNRAGITGLNEGQRVYVGVAEGRKGRVGPIGLVIRAGAQLGVTKRQRVSLTTRAAAAAATRATTSVLIASGQRSSGR